MTAPEGITVQRCRPEPDCRLTCPARTGVTATADFTSLGLPFLICNQGDAGACSGHPGTNAGQVCLEHHSVHSALLPLPGVARVARPRLTATQFPEWVLGSRGWRCCRGDGNCVRERQRVQLGVRKTADFSEGQADLWQLTAGLLSSRSKH